MQYGHLDNNNRMVLAKLPIIINNQQIFTTDGKLFLQIGEKEIHLSPKPIIQENEKLIEKWNETETSIKQIWEVVPIMEQSIFLLQKYNSYVKKYIAERYTPSDETKITREYLAYGESYKQAFTEYNTYVEDCKKRAYKEVYGIDKPEEVK